MGACRPNAAHVAIARRTLEHEGARLVTQNVDGLHELALEEARVRRDAGQLRL